MLDARRRAPLCKGEEWKSGGVTAVAILPKALPKPSRRLRLQGLELTLPDWKCGEISEHVVRSILTFPYMTISSKHVSHVHGRRLFHPCH
jgi:hypothetical protein